MSIENIRISLSLSLLCLFLVVCDAYAEIVIEEFPGVSGTRCLVSPYNCSLNNRKGDGQLIIGANGDWWPVKKMIYEIPVYDGNGDLIGFTNKKKFQFNLGQMRSIAGQLMVFAKSTGLGSTGWIPSYVLENADELPGPNINSLANSKVLQNLGCFEISETYDESLEGLKVVRDARSKNERPTDYLPLKRKGGKTLMNLAFNVPGFSLGGAAIDIFPSGTKVNRLDVPTLDDSYRSEISVPLYEKNPITGRYTKNSGSMSFVYVGIQTKENVIRYGWMAKDGLVASESCPNIRDINQVR
jgi:hypothetical protein